jgi:Fe-S-cluster containining protein
MPSDAVSPERFFVCRQCGECCRGFGGTYVTEADMSAIAAYLGHRPETFAQNYCRRSGSRWVLAQGAEGFCVFARNRLCVIHPVKPRMCRQWPFIENVLKEPENWRLMASMCPGIRVEVPRAELMACIARMLERSV